MAYFSDNAIILKTYSGWCAWEVDPKIASASVSCVYNQIPLHGVRLTSELWTSCSREAV